MAAGLLAASHALPAAGEAPVQMNPFEVTAQSTTIGDVPEAQMSKLDVYATPGAAADINRALQLLPGVSLVDEGNALYVKGGAADETKTYVNDIPYPTTHQSEAPAGTSDTTLATSYLQSASLYAGNVPARYGDALSGVVALETLPPVQQTRVTLDASVGGAAALVQSPLRSGGWNTGGSFSDLAAVVRLNPTTFAYSQPPRAEDLFLSVEWAPAPGLDAEAAGDQKVSEAAFGVSSPSFAGTFRSSVRTSFTAERLKGVSAGGWEWKIAAGGGRQVRRESLGTLDLRTESKYGALAADGTKELSPTASFGAGIDGLVAGGGIQGTVPATESLSPVVPPLPVNYSGSGQQWSGYASLNWRPAPRLEVVTGLRSDSFLNQPGGTLVEPRLSAAWQVSPDQTLSFYSGELAKAPTAAQQVEAIGRLNPARAHESSLTFGQRDRHFSLQLSAFLKEYRDLTEANREFRTVGGNRGRARGFTAGISTNPVRKVTLGLDYTFSHSYRTDPDSGLMAPSAFDVRQTLSLTSKFQLGYSTLTIAYRFATGKPYTPVAGAIPGPAPGQFTPIYGSPESQRLPDFNRFDVSGSRLLFLHHQLWIPYLSIMNVLNQKNTYAYTYSADYRQKFAQPSLYRRTIYFGVSTVF